MSNSVHTKIEVENSEQKFEELLLYIADKCENHDYFGAVKLNKILFFSDFLYYKDNGTPITGMEYQKLPQGPSPRRLVPVREQLIADGDAVIKERAVPGGRAQKRLIAIRQPNLSLFSGDEIAFIDNVIDTLQNRSAQDVSDLSHGKAWQAAREGESIPYEAVFISDDKPDTIDKIDGLALFGLQN